MQTKNKKDISFLSEREGRKGYKLVAASMPLPVSDYLALYSLAKGTNKSKIITGLVSTWIHEIKMSGIQDTKLIAIIVERINKDWKRRKKAYPNLHLLDYKKGISRELFKKKLNKEQVTQILNLIK